MRPAICRWHPVKRCPGVTLSRHRVSVKAAAVHVPKERWDGAPTCPLPGTSSGILGRSGGRDILPTGGEKAARPGRLARGFYEGSSTGWDA